MTLTLLDLFTAAQYRDVAREISGWITVRYLNKLRATCRGLLRYIAENYREEIKEYLRWISPVKHMKLILLKIGNQFSVHSPIENADTWPGTLSGRTWALEPGPGILERAQSPPYKNQHEDLIDLLGMNEDPGTLTGGNAQGNGQGNGRGNGQGNARGNEWGNGNGPEWGNGNGPEWGNGNGPEWGNGNGPEWGNARGNALITGEPPRSGDMLAVVPKDVPNWSEVCHIFMHNGRRFTRVQGIVSSFLCHPRPVGFEEFHPNHWVGFMTRYGFRSMLLSTIPVWENHLSEILRRRESDSSVVTVYGHELKVHLARSPHDGDYMRCRSALLSDPKHQWNCVKIYLKVDSSGCFVVEGLK